MAFPSPGDNIYYNDAGEPLGWDKPADPADYWCDDCGFSHPGPCPDPEDEDEGNEELPEDEGNENAES